MKYKSMDYMLQKFFLEHCNGPFHSRGGGSDSERIQDDILMRVSPA